MEPSVFFQFHKGLQPPHRSSEGLHLQLFVKLHDSSTCSFLCLTLSGIKCAKAHPYFCQHVCSQLLLSLSSQQHVWFGSRSLNLDISLHKHRTTGGIVTPLKSNFIFILILFLTPYSIIIIVIIIIMLSLHTSKRSPSLKNEYATLFSVCRGYEGSVNEVFFFVTNVKTQTFYRIVQFLSLLFGGWKFLPFRVRGGNICQHVCYSESSVVVLLSFQMKIYMNIYEDNTSLKLQVWFRYLWRTYSIFFNVGTCVFPVSLFPASLPHVSDSSSAALLCALTHV